MVASIFLMTVDQFTKWLECFPLPQQSAEETARCVFDGFVSRFGCPLEIHTDQEKTARDQSYSRDPRIRQRESSSSERQRNHYSDFYRYDGRDQPRSSDADNFRVFWSAGQPSGSGLQDVARDDRVQSLQSSWSPAWNSHSSASRSASTIPVPDLYVSGQESEAVVSVLTQIYVIISERAIRESAYSPRNRIPPLNQGILLERCSQDIRTWILRLAQPTSGSTASSSLRAPPVAGIIPTPPPAPSGLEQCSKSPSSVTHRSRSPVRQDGVINRKSQG